MRQKIVASNFKMNMDHLESTFYLQKLAWLLQDCNHDFTKVEIVLLSSFTNLRSLQILCQADKLQVQFGSQDVSLHRDGAFTGEVSAKQLSKLGCSYALVGHTERRKFFGEDDEMMMRKATRCLEENVKPILCIGELDEEAREVPDFDFLFEQLRPIVDRINSIGKDEVIPFLEKCVIAYEPRWAVSNGQTCSAKFVNDVFTGLRKKMIEELGHDAAYTIRLIYGGSVSLNSVAQIISQDEVDGVLVGKSSLDVENFSKIIRVVNKTVEAINSTKSSQAGV